jgi:hypothetical protein
MGAKCLQCALMWARTDDRKMTIVNLIQRYKRWNPVHPTYGAFWGIGVGLGCGVQGSKRKSVAAEDHVSQLEPLESNQRTEFPPEAQSVSLSAYQRTSLSSKDSLSPVSRALQPRSLSDESKEQWVIQNDFKSISLVGIGYDLLQKRINLRRLVL